jgi:hypothetical protein
MIYELYWKVIVVYIISIVLQSYYVYNKPTLTIIETLFIATLNIVCLVLLILEYPVPQQVKDTPEFISFGSSLSDAMLGRKYNYDLIVDAHKKYNK